jgi:phospholipid/cholesterol/gamma-HCH transport system substrate-binding protein
MNRQMIDFWVGIFVALGIAATVFIALRVANLTTFSNGPAYDIIAEFENIGGLKIKAPVKEAGVVVGHVKDIHLDTDKHMAIVTLEIEQQYQFSIDASANIYTSGLLGEQYIGLQDGAESDTLKSGDTLLFTSSALVLEKLISEYMFNKASEDISK